MVKANQKLLTFLEENPKSTKNQIQEGTSIKGLELYNLLRKLKTEETIIEHPNQTYSIATIDGEEQELETATESTKPVLLNPKGETRDSSKYKFEGEEYGKGPLVKAVVARYVADNPKTTYKQLKEIFPDELLKRFGIFQDEKTAKEIAPKGKRYFEKPEQMIKLKDRSIIVCNQFTLDNIQPFLKVAKTLGYKIK